MDSIWITVHSNVHTRPTYTHTGRPAPMWHCRKNSTKCCAQHSCGVNCSRNKADMSALDQYVCCELVSRPFTGRIQHTIGVGVKVVMQLWRRKCVKKAQIWQLRQLHIYLGLVHGGTYLSTDKAHFAYWTDIGPGACFCLFDSKSTSND